MAGGVGNTIKLPIVSTFDASGVTAAEAGMKRLQSAGGTGGGGGGMPRLKPAAPPSADKAPGMPDLKQLASQVGLRAPVDELSKFFSPSMGAAAGATAAFALTQKFASEAREIRIESQKLGTTTKFYRDLAWNAREAGVSLNEVTAGMDKVNSKAGAAMGGDIASQAYFASMGISTQQLQGMSGDSGKLAQLVAQRGSGAQQIQGFGSLEAARVAGQSGSPVGYGRAVNDALEAANLKIQDIPGKLLDVGNSIFGNLAFKVQATGRAWGGGMSHEQAESEMYKEAAEKESYEALQRHNAAATEAGTKKGATLLNPREEIKYEADAEKGYNYSQMTALTGISSDTFHARAETQRMQKQQAFEGQFQNPYEKYRAQQAITERQEQEGTLTGVQSYRAQWANWEQATGAVAGTRSNAENARNAMTSFGAKWNDPGIAANKQKEVDAANATLEAAKKKLATAKIDEDNVGRDRYDTGGVELMTGKSKEWYDKRVGGAAANTASAQQGVADAQKALDTAKGKTSIEQRDAAMAFGDQLTDYVQGLTSAGPQTAAAGVNTVQGASTLMAAEYQMDQSQDTRRMVEILLKIAENTGRVTKEQREAVTANLGRRTNDPISGLFGGK